jgi:hypothetical protein
MALTLNVTATEKTGPAEALTAAKFTDVRFFRFEPKREMLVLDMEDGTHHEIEMHDAATITVAISSGVYTVTIS